MILASSTTNANFYDKLMRDFNRYTPDLEIKNNQSFNSFLYNSEAALLAGDGILYGLTEKCCFISEYSHFTRTIYNNYKMGLLSVLN